jgi:hypothetical protein
MSDSDAGPCTVFANAEAGVKVDVDHSVEKHGVGSGAVLLSVAVVALAEHRAPPSTPVEHRAPFNPGTPQNSISHLPSHNISRSASSAWDGYGWVEEEGECHEVCAVK